MIAETVQILTEFICWFIALLKSLLSLKSDLVSQTNLKRLQYGPQKCLKLHVGRKCQTCPELPIDILTSEGPMGGMEHYIQGPEIS